MANPRVQAENPAASVSWPRPEPVAERRDSRPAQLIDLEPYRRRLSELQRDAGLNAIWDELLAGAKEAWSWRDPESLLALEGCIERLRKSVFEDWGYSRKG